MKLNDPIANSLLLVCIIVTRIIKNWMTLYAIHKGMTRII